MTYLIVVVGHLMPVRYVGHTVVELDGTLPRVWDALQDPEAHPLTRLVREMALGSVNMKSRWEYEMEPAGEGCRATLGGVA